MGCVLEKSGLQTSSVRRSLERAKIRPVARQTVMWCGGMFLTDIILGLQLGH